MWFCLVWVVGFGFWMFWGVFLWICNRMVKVVKEVAILDGILLMREFGIEELSVIKCHKISLTCYRTCLKLPQVCVLYGELADFFL